ncbi:MAG TPA: pilus assembly protein PilP [Candidatus Acidoferrum sp.]|jgi:type IV pilus assembly protein PilP|nr:pilus assembly protein PilP [Candidatus Acidoferrum sp.]
MRSALTLVLGILLAAAAPGLRAQASPAAPQPGKPAAPAAAKKPPAKPATQKVAKAPKPAKPVETAVNPDAPKEGEQAATTSSARRDPFESLVARQQAQARATSVLPPGKAGLQVSTLRLDGIVKAPNGMIAVVTNPQARTYFLREGDQLYDGRVEKIAMDGVSFHEIGKDAFGKPVERQVNKRIYSSAGEQQ